jgi:hypothetical protein
MATMARLLYMRLGGGNKKVKHVEQDSHRQTLRAVNEKLRQGVAGIRRERLAIEAELEGNHDDDGEPT